MSNFTDAFALIIGEEGGYTPGVGDPGGETKYGISKRAYPDEDIKNLTLEGAQEIYKRDYWDAHDFDNFEYGKALLMFDCAVNGGPWRIWRDQFVSLPVEEFAVNFQAEHILYLASLNTLWPRFGRGWVRRAIRMFKSSVGGNSGT